jgi:hypothetical protein
VSILEHSIARTTAYCEQCALIARAELSPDVLVGPLIWGADWQEIIEWVERSLSSARSPSMGLLIAHEVRRQRVHLAEPPPARVMSLLKRFDPGAG